ncbi:MAG TPA: BrnA antitoxin family protein [Thermoanaerobaculia bacterium]|nr:BrnA antitoxin family protein [Thermoanaerobaculia bacterium]
MARPADRPEPWGRASGPGGQFVYTLTRCDSSGTLPRRQRISRHTESALPRHRKVAAEPYRDIDFSQAKRGPVVKAEPGKTKISIRLDSEVIEAFRKLADQAGGGNYQTLINDALVAHLHQRTILEAVRQVVREELGEPAPRRARQVGSRSKANG